MPLLTSTAKDLRISSMPLPSFTTGKPMTGTPSAICTSAEPFGIDQSAVKAIEKGLSNKYRFSCGASAATVEDCPYLCNRGPSNHTLHLCSDKDISDPMTASADTRLACQHCLLPNAETDASGISSGSTSSSATCTSTDPAGTLCPLVKYNATSSSNSPVFQSRCGTTTAEIADCPFLCTTVDPGYVDVFRCVNEDVSGKNTVWDEYHMESCTRCLPACT